MAVTSPRPDTRFTFATFHFSAATLELTKDGRRVALEPQPARLLAALLARAGDVVTREELRQSLWGDDTHVDYDRGLAYSVGQVRTALGDQADTPRFVQTLPKRGFRFIAPVQVEPPAVPARGQPAPVEEARADVAPESAQPNRSHGLPRWAWLAVTGLLVAALVGWAARPSPMSIVAVSIFDNETGQAAYDPLVTGLSDVVVTRLTSLAPGRVGVVGNLAALRQPRNIRNLEYLANTLRADYILLGQLQPQGDDLRFIVHLVRLADGVHLSAQRLIRRVDEVQTFEAAVVAEAERAVRTHVLPAGGA